jgi:thioredoxin reductase (NADPH)
MTSRSYDVVIIGAGPAGLSAAIYTARQGLKTLVIDESSAGGQVKTTHKVANYPGFVEPIDGFVLAKNMKDQAKLYGTEFELVTEVTGFSFTDTPKWIELEGDEIIETEFVIIATGRSPRKLGLPGEDEFAGQGISYCATCDGEFYKDKEIFVIGGGNSAMEESLLLLSYVKKLTVIHQFDHLQAEKITGDRVLSNPKVEILWSHEPRKFMKVGDQMVVEIENLKTKKQFQMTRDGVFIFVGMSPNSVFLKNSEIEFNEFGYIPTNERMETNLKGVYAVGDIRDKFAWQITTAVSDGTIAALEIVKQLNIH